LIPSRRRPDIPSWLMINSLTLFVDQKRFNIVERTKLDKVLLEQKLTKAKLTDPEHSIKVGRLMSADAIIATSVKEDKKSIEVVSRVIQYRDLPGHGGEGCLHRRQGPWYCQRTHGGAFLKDCGFLPLVEGWS